MTVGNSFVSGYDKAFLYEEDNAFHHTSPCLAYYQAVSEGMNLQDVHTVPKDMNKKGYDALCRFFKGPDSEFNFLFLFFTTAEVGFGFVWMATFYSSVNYSSVFMDQCVVFDVHIPAPRTTGDIAQDPREDRSMFEKRKRAHGPAQGNRPKAKVAKPKAIADRPPVHCVDVEVVAVISDSESNHDLDENLDIYFKGTNIFAVFVGHCCQFEVIGKPNMFDIFLYILPL